MKTTHYQRLCLLTAALGMIAAPTDTVAAQPPAAATSSSVSDAGSAKSTVDELSARIRKSLVIVRATGRDGREYGHGTGFVVSEDGLIATARHVIGDRRAIRVELQDGKQLPVTHIHAVTEAVDLAVLRVDAKDLTPLRLGDISAMRAGQQVVAAGYPGSTQYSVFSGILSGREEIDGISMLELALMVDGGSSGEPVVNDQGDVIGIVTLKSTRTSNLGFAVPVDHLQALLEDPTPMAMNRWMHIGALDPAQWDILWGANWRQRASRILVDGYGESFGGRSLCLRTVDAPAIPFELQVDVKLDDESGAAGLAFHADGEDKHYGFYPSAGNARLTRFNGPDLNSWTILHNEPHPAYRPGEWNTFKVRVEQNRILCFVNEQLAFESSDSGLQPGRIGLATFRGTSAGFRHFRFGADLPSAMPGAEDARTIAQILQSVDANQPASSQTVSQLQQFSRFTSRVLEKEAQQLEQRAQRIRQLAVDVHAAETRRQIVSTLTDKASAAPDLLKAALLIAVLDNEEIEPQTYLDRVDQLADEVRQAVPENASEAQRLNALDKLLFEEYGFRGSRYEYYTRSNSYLNEVIDDREGLPITLSVLYIELARRLNLHVVGLGLPGHYVVRFEPSDQSSEPQIIDVFNRGQRLSQQEAETLVKSRGFPLLPEFLEGQPADVIVSRILRNLLGLAESKREDERVLRYLDTLVAINPTDPEFRAKRLEIRARTERLAEAIQDADWFIDHQPDGVNLDRLYELRAQLQRAIEQ